MKHFNFKIVLALFLFFSLSLSAEAGVKLRHGVRPMGLGGAFVSIADDGTAVWWNPAGLGYRDVAEFNISGGRIYGRMRGPSIWDVYANSIQPLGKLGVGAWHFTMLQVPFDTGNSSIGDGHYQEGVFGLSLGRKFRMKRPLSVGTSFNLLVKNINANSYVDIDPLFEDQKRLYKFGLDLGLIWQFSESFTLGAAIRNVNEPNFAFGPEAGYDDTDKLPYTFQTGISYRKNLQSWSWRAALEYSTRHRWINSEPDETIHFGTEGWFFHGMTGFRFGFNRDEFSLGFSGRVNQQSMPIQLDLAYTVPITEMENPGNIWRAALRFQFGREGGFAPEITIKEFQMNSLFAAMYKYYATTPVGTVEIFNDTNSTFKNIKVGLLISRYMDFPTEMSVEKLAPYERKTIPLFASLNNTVLKVEEDTPMQAKLTVTYNLANQQAEQSLAKTFTLFSRNALNWADPAKIGTFITPKNSTIDYFVKQAIYAHIPENANSPYPNLSQAMQLFGIFSAYGLRYVIDPNNPYNGPLVGDEAIDYIRYPTETLKLRSGDCDDLAMLYCAALENLGISSGLIDIPGHVFTIFELGLTMPEALQIGLPADLLLSWDDMSFRYPTPQDSVALAQLAQERYWNEHVWIPVETTLFGAGSFIESWQIGVENYLNASGQRRIILIQDAWRTYAPATLDPDDWEPPLPNEDRVRELLRADKKRLLQEQSGRKIEGLLQQINSGENPDDAFNSLGVIFCQGGLFEEGQKYFRDALIYNPEHAGAHNNLGNIFYQNARWDEAIESYEAALKADPEDAGIYVNIALAYYKKGDYIQAKDYLRRAIDIYPGYSKLYESLWREEQN